MATTTAKKTTKTAAATTTATTKKTAPAKTALPAPSGTDQFGRRLGTTAAKMNQVIIKAGKAGVTAADVAERTDATAGFASAHLANLCRQGHVARIEAGRYAVASKPTKKRTK